MIAAITSLIIYRYIGSAPLRRAGGVSVSPGGDAGVFTYYKKTAGLDKNSEKI